MDSGYSSENWFNKRPLLKEYVWLLFSLNGQANRSQFWKGGLVAFLVGALSLFSLFVSQFHAAEIVLVPLSGLLILLASWIVVSVTVKRYHDRNKSGWWSLIYLVPAIGILWILNECGGLEGTPGPNNYEANADVRHFDIGPLKSFVTAISTNFGMSLMAVILAILWVNRCPGCDNHIGEPGADLLLGIIFFYVTVFTVPFAGVVSAIISYRSHDGHILTSLIVGVVFSIPVVLASVWIASGSEYSERDASWTAAEVPIVVAAHTDIMQVRYHSSPIACTTWRNTKGRSKLIDDRGYIYVILNNGCKGYVKSEAIVERP